MFFNTLSSLSASSCSSTKLVITSEDQRNFKSTLHKMQGQMMSAQAMYLITNETIYLLTMETAKSAIKSLKKVIRRGVCQYKKGSKTDIRLSSYKRIYSEYESMILKMEIKKVPSKADFVIECWLKKDAAQKAAKEYKNETKEDKKNGKEIQIQMVLPTLSLIVKKDVV